MVFGCVALGCKEKRIKGGQYTFHSFPKDNIRCRQWIIKMRRANFSVSKHSRICSKHFTKDCFDTERFGGTWLKEDAVPTLFDFPVQKKNEKARKNEVAQCTPTTSSNDQQIKIEDLEEDMDSPLEKIKLKYSLATQEENMDSPSKTKNFRYLGDFQEEDMESPSKAKKVFFLAKKMQKKHRTEIINLQQRLRRSQERVLSLKKTITELRYLIPDTAGEVLDALPE